MSSPVVDTLTVPVLPNKNRYMIYLSANRSTIIGMLSTENPELKGRELMTATTVRAGVMWKALTDAEKDAAIEQANAVIASRPATEPKPPKTKTKKSSTTTAKKSKTDTPPLTLTPEELFLSKQLIRRAKELEVFTAKQAEKSQRELAKFTDELKAKSESTSI
jgi:hypothetical protein